jgi:hypothetical protein
MQTNGFHHGVTKMLAWGNLVTLIHDLQVRDQIAHSGQLHVPNWPFSQHITLTYRTSS